MLFGSAGAEASQLGQVTHNGQTVKVGDRVTGGMLRFADGSIASLEDGLSVDVITSFRRPDGSYYTVLRVPLGEEGVIGLEVNPRSRVEVVTPAAIAGSEGTRFYVKVERDRRGADACLVYVVRGKVRMKTRGRRPAQQLIFRSEAYRGERPSGRIVRVKKFINWRLPWLPDWEKHYSRPKWHRRRHGDR